MWSGPSNSSRYVHDYCYRFYYSYCDCYCYYCYCYYCYCYYCYYFYYFPPTPTTSTTYCYYYINANRKQILHHLPTSPTMSEKSWMLWPRHWSSCSLSCEQCSEPVC